MHQLATVVHQQNRRSPFIVEINMHGPAIPVGFYKFDAFQIWHWRYDILAALCYSFIAILYTSYTAIQYTAVEETNKRCHANLSHNYTSSMVALIFLKKIPGINFFFIF